MKFFWSRTASQNAASLQKFPDHIAGMNMCFTNTQPSSQFWFAELRDEKYLVL